jgi:hypothetical protein
MKTEYKTTIYTRKAQKAFYDRNKDLINENMKSYYHENKASILEKKKEIYKLKKEMKNNINLND